MVNRITQPRNKEGTEKIDFLLDEDWAKKAFIVPDIVLEKDDQLNRYWSTTDSKFTDTTLGGNIGINQRPGFTPYADIPCRGRLAGRSDLDIRDHEGNFGMGRYYGEAIDESAQVIYMCFGVPEFNTLTNFLRHAYDPAMISIARTGKAPSVFYELGKAVGSAAMFVAFPGIAITLASIRTAEFLFARPMHKFYTFKETMLQYWTAVNTLVNVHAINRGIMPKIVDDMARAMNLSDAVESQRVNQPFKLDQDYLNQLAISMPDIFHGNSLFDMYAIANKAQRMANQLFEEDYSKIDNATSTDYLGYVKKTLTGDGTHGTPLTNMKGTAPTLAARMKDWLNWGYDKNDNTDQTKSVGLDYRVDPTKEEDTSWWTPFKQTLTAQWNDGSKFAVFRVEHTGQVQESFGNSVVESELSSKLNGISSQVRDVRFSTMDGNIMGGIGGMVQDVVGAGVDLALGAADGLTGGLSNVIQGLAGSGFIDIPKHWQSSSAQLPKASYRMKLVTPYNNPISEIMNIWIPFYMVLAGALPLSTGKASFTSPFLCQVYDRGRLQIRLGMIESFSATRGITNLPWDKEGHALGIELSFSVVDLSSIMHMPIGTGPIKSINMTLDEDNILSDYLATLAGMDVNSQIYTAPKAKLALAKMVMQATGLFSASRWAMSVHQFSKWTGVGQVLEGLSRGSNIGIRSGV